MSELLTCMGSGPCVCAASAGLGKTEIVVRRDVERAGFGTSQDLRVVVVGGDSVEENNGSPSNTGNWLGEAFVHPGFQTTGIK